jgi:hypothetical protein
MFSLSPPKRRTNLGPVFQNYKIYVIPNGVILKLYDYVISFSYSIQNVVSD